VLELWAWYGATYFGRTGGGRCLVDVLAVGRGGMRLVVIEYTVLRHIYLPTIVLGTTAAFGIKASREI